MIYDVYFHVFSYNFRIFFCIFCVFVAYLLRSGFFESRPHGTDLGAEAALAWSPDALCCG